MNESKATLAATLVFLGLSATAHAETLTIEGLTSANQPGFSKIETIAIDRFDGSDGQPLAFELEDQLSSATLFDQPYFEVIGGRSAVEPDATLSGNVTVDIDQYETTAKRNRCIARNDKDKCTERKDIVVDCLQRSINFRARVRGVRFEDGRNIYSESFPREEDETICFGDDKEFSKNDSVIRKMISDTAREIRNDLAPRQYRREIRVLESRKGMTKSEGKFFKAAVKMTKKDAAQACRMWDEMAVNGLSNISLAFNRGLCAERSGDLSNAMVYYREAQTLSSKKYEVGQALNRVNDHQRALDEWDLRRSDGSTVKSN
ncbi:MAG: hypothetical protein ABJN65_02935 [Parasphingorhabdus sp.]